MTKKGFMRIKNSLKNISIGILSQIIFVVLGLFSRKIFISSLGIKYLGVNGLLINVLSMLGLIESGIGVSIVYNLYKPLATNNKREVIALVQLYKKLYKILAIIVLMLSFSIFPIILKITSSERITNISIVYYIFVTKNIISYLNAHKWSLIIADQKGYILKRLNLIFKIMAEISKIMILFLIKDYILYLIVEVAVLIFQNIYNGRIVSERYPYIRSKRKYSVENDIKLNVIKNTKALFWHNLGGFCVFGTDNLLISYFINIATVGIYSNYTMIANHLMGIIIPVLNGMDASIGNLIAVEGKEKRYEVYKIIYFINYGIYSIFVIFLFNLLEPFITWWLGREYLLDRFTFIIILVNIYLTGMRYSLGMFKAKAGIFHEDRFIPVLESLINLGSSIILVNFFGLAGIFLGTTVSTLSTVFWTVPYLVYKHVFDRPLKEYFIGYFYYGILMIVTGMVTSYLCNLTFNSITLLSLIGKGMMAITVPGAIYLIIFYKTKEFQYLLNLFINLFIKFIYRKDFKSTG